MKNNTFTIKGTVVSIENGFIPYNKEYTRLTEIIEAKDEISGSFKMQFTSPYHGNAFLLTVTYLKK